YGKRFCQFAKSAVVQAFQGIKEQDLCSRYGRDHIHQGKKDQDPLSIGKRLYRRFMTATMRPAEYFHSLVSHMERYLDVRIDNPQELVTERSKIGRAH